MKINLMFTVFTAWDYQLSFLELLAFLVSLVAVGLAVIGPRKTWHSWNASSVLYGILFLEEKYFASAAASLTDAFGFVGSSIGQLWMVLEKYEAWPLWFVVDAVYTYQFFHGGQYLTSILYFIFVLLAIAGWRSWLKKANL